MSERSLDQTGENKEMCTVVPSDMAYPLIGSSRVEQGIVGKLYV